MLVNYPSISLTCQDLCWYHSETQSTTMTQPWGVNEKVPLHFLLAIYLYFH